MFGTEIERLANKRMSGDHPNYSIIKIGQNTEKSPDDLRRLADTQTPVKNYQLTLVWKTLKTENNNNNNISGEPGSSSRQNYVAETLSKE